MPSPVCVHIPPSPPPQRLTLPGGVTLEHLEFLDVVQPALTPLMPFFDLLETVLALFDAVKAVPEAIGPPPDPTALARALQKVAEKIAGLLRLVPQLSLPLTVVGLIDLLVRELGKTRDLLVHLQGRLDATERMVERARQFGDGELARLAACVRSNIEQEAANAGQRLGALGGLVAILNLFTAMIGAPSVPDLGALSGTTLDTLIAPLDALVQTLRAVRSAVPLP